MIEELVIHLGDCKTGTTSVQTTLARRQFSAEGRELVYPTRLNHLAFSNSVGRSPQDAMGMAKSLAGKFQSSKADIGVISAENFEYASPANLAALFEGPFKPWRDRVRMIAYIRPHAERFVAAFTERSKLGTFDGTMEEFAEKMGQRGLFNYAPRVAEWKAQFGERYNVRPFIRDQLQDGDVVRDFFSFTFGDTPVTLTEATQQNESLSLEDLMLIRYMHRVLRKQGKELFHSRRTFGWFFAELLAARPGGSATKVRLHESMARILQETYGEDAAALDAQAFEGTPMSDRLAAATKDAPETAQSFEPRDYYSPQSLRQTAALAELLGRVMASDRDHFAWAARPEEFREPHPPRRQRRPETTDQPGAAEQQSALGSVMANLKGVLRR